MATRHGLGSEIRPVDILVTLGTLGHEGLLEAMIDSLELLTIVIGAPTAWYSMSLKAGCPCCMEMRLMTLQAEERLLLLEQVVRHCAVGIMADEAVFHYWIVLIYERTLIAGMAGQAEVIQPLVSPQHALFKAGTPMGIVTV